MNESVNVYNKQPNGLQWRSDLTNENINCAHCSTALAIVAAGRARLLDEACTQGARLIATVGCYVAVCYVCPAATPYVPLDASWGDRVATISRAAYITQARERADSETAQFVDEV